MVDWQRKRQPEDVPTPVAIAVADFCRRAQSPAPPEAVREALSLLTAQDDLKLCALCADAPAARPLGPFAAVDLVFGTAPAIAAERQRTGYYELVRQLASARAPAAAPPSPRATPRPAEARPRVSAPLPPVSAPPARRGKGKAKRGAGPTLQERIAPKKRKDTPRATPPPAPSPPVSTWRKRELPAPRGLFSTVSAVKQKTETLKEPRSRDFLEGLVAQSETRYGVWKSLEQHYSTKGNPISLHDVEAVLERHGLLEPLSLKERDGVVSQLVQSRGGLERAARALGLSGKVELLSLARAVGAKKTVEEIRDRFAREALSPAHLPLRLDLAGKLKYLTDLGIARQFDTALARDLKELLGDAAAVDLYEVSRRTGFNAELLERAATRLGLLGPNPAPRS